MIRVLLGIVGMACLLGAIVSVLFGIYYVGVMHRGVKPDKKPFLPFLGPFQLFIPQLWNEEGNRARGRFLVCISLFLLLFGTVSLILSSNP